jgi:hypothetical protein
MSNSGFTQSLKDSFIPIIKSGYGYFNDELTIDGDFLWSEVGLKLKNNYILSLNFKLGETINDKGNFYNYGIESAELIYTEKILTLFMGYDFRTKDRKHSFIPELGPFYSRQNTEWITIDNDNNTIIKKNSFEDIGVAVELCYLFHLKSKISFGLTVSGYLAYQIGPLYYTISPVISVFLE